MNTAVVGSRSFHDYTFFKDILEGYEITQIISGGARGADELAKRYALEKNLEIQIFQPDYARYGKSDLYASNHSVIDRADQVVAFWDRKSLGTAHSIKYAQKQGKKVFIIPVGKDK
jgi:predicted Rossmann fold nucleotide-binding protein DprA/Smf involved in DNA uptake